jgi:hypothetical protein
MEIDAINFPSTAGRTRCVARARSNQYDTVRERTLQSLVALLEKKGACKKLWFTMNQAKLNRMKRESHPNNRLLRQHQMHDSRTPVWIKGNCREVGSKRGSQGQGGGVRLLPCLQNITIMI